MSVRTLFRKRSLLLLLAAGVISIGAVACGDDDDDDDVSPTATTAAEATATTASEPTAGPTATTASESTGATGAEPTATSEPEASAEGVSVTVAESDELGSFLVGPDGLTLYVFTRDMPDTSNCVDNCLQIWPPLLLEEGQEVEPGDGATGEFGSIDTPSGTQVTYNQAPLYYFASDAAAGDTSGHMVGGVWFVARPDTASTAVVNVSAGGDYLVAPDGLTLYTFDNDTEGVSNCSGGCLENWPALTVPEGLAPTAVSAASGALDTITRDDDGTFQVTYNGLPLYYFAGDSLPGDTNGDGVGGVWVLATP